MHDIWNPWHGCVKCSEGCQNCYMYFLDRQRNRDGSDIFKTKSGFNYPLQKKRSGGYKIQSGELIRVCMTSDFFLEEADAWRNEAWEIMRQRPDVKFFLLTKRPQRVKDCLPDDWGDGWENVMLNVSCENQRRADELAQGVGDIVGEELQALEVAALDDGPPLGLMVEVGAGQVLTLQQPPGPAPRAGRAVELQRTPDPVVRTSAQSDGLILGVAGLAGLLAQL